MLRADLFKKFSKSSLPKTVDGIDQPAKGNQLTVNENPKTNNWGSADNFNFNFKAPSLFNLPDNNQGMSADINTAGQTRITGEPRGNGSPFVQSIASPNFGVQTPDFLSTFGQGNNIIQGSPLGTTTGKDLNGNESSFAPGYGPQTATQKIEGTAKKSKPDYNSMFTLGLGAVDVGLENNADLRNQRILNESIQNRQSKPLYDYNYMYGRTTSGGTEYQPTIKAEMGAQITKRFNTPYGANNVEIEGGEFIQLPNFDTEHAEGPSHERGGIKTSLPEGTRVYSDHLKPDGSKKTFAQLAKKYDISGYKTTIDDPFKKQVDKDTATIMLKRNQAKLDELFNNQQSLNGDSNGEMRDGGIHNPGFRALPKAVQDQIMANMEYGGYQLPEYADGGGFNNIDHSGLKVTAAEQIKNRLAELAKNVSKPQPTTSNSFQAPWLKNTQVESVYNPLQVSPLQDKASSQVLGSTLKSAQNARPNLKSAPKNVQALANSPSGITKEGIPTYTAEDIKTIQKWDPTFKPAIDTVPGLQKTQGSTYGEPTNQELFNKNYQWYTDKLKAEGKTFNPSNKGDVAVAQKAYHSEMIKRFIDAGYTPEEANVAITKYGFTDKEGVPNAFDDKLGKYTASRQLFNVAKKTPETPVVTRDTPVVALGPPKGNNYDVDIANNAKGRYTRTPYDITQSIPDIYGLAEAQSIFPYAIPEINAPYVRPQTLNVQSELQDLDNMGTAAVRAGADPLATYIAGMDSKQKAFQTKQNYDANARSQADQFNAQGQLNADQMNANSFNRVYNELIGNARANQSTIKQDQLSSLTENYANWNNSQTNKELYYNNLIPSFNLDLNKTTDMEVAGSQPFTRTKATTIPNNTTGGKKGMLVSRATSKKSLTKFKK